VDYLFRGVEVGAGEHTIRMVYQPTSFWAGSGITLLCLIVLLGLWIYERRQQKKPSPASNA
jgi:uncharacterized membrane protein YfhO